MFQKAFVVFMGVVFFATFNAMLAARAENPQAAAPFEVGKISYTNQWEFEKPRSVLFLGYSSYSLSSSRFQIEDYVADLEGTSVALPSLNYFTEVIPLGRSRFSFYGQYDLGLNVLRTKLTNPDLALSDVTSRANLFFYELGAGLNLTYEIVPVLRPYLGAHLILAGYRHTGSVSGAEKQSSGWYWAPAVGILFPGLVFGQGSLYAQASLPVVLKDSDALISPSWVYSVGMGLCF